MADHLIGTDVYLRLPRLVRSPRPEQQGIFADLCLIRERTWRVLKFRQAHFLSLFDCLWLITEFSLLSGSWILPCLLSPVPHRDPLRRLQESTCRISVTPCINRIVHELRDARRPKLQSDNNLHIAWFGEDAIYCQAH